MTDDRLQFEVLRLNKYEIYFGTKLHWIVSHKTDISKILKIQKRTS